MNPYMFFVSLFFSLVGVLPSFGQSITLHEYTCDNTVYGSVPVGPFQEKVAFSAIIPPGTSWALYSYQNGVQTFEDSLHQSVALDSLIIECAPIDPSDQFNDFNLNLQLAGIDTVVYSQVFILAGELDPPSYDNCQAIELVTTGLGPTASTPVIKAWPNPFTEALTLEGPEEFKFSASDMLGRLVLAGRSTGRTATLEGLLAGSYAITMEWPNGRETIRVICER